MEHIKVGIRWGKDSLYGRGIVYCEYARICLEELGELGSVVGRESIEDGLGVRRDAEEDNSQNGGGIHDCRCSKDGGATTDSKT